MAAARYRAAAMHVTHHVGPASTRPDRRGHDRL